MKFTLVATILVGLSASALAQTERGLSTTVVNERSSIGGYHASIPNPNRDLAVVSFARNKSVLKEIALPEATAETLLQLIEESGGSLSSPGVSGKSKPEDENLLHIELHAKLKGLREKNVKAVPELLDPSQINRFRQLVYQIEIARVGLGEALIKGFLGTDIGIEAYQKPELEIRAKAIEAKANESTKMVLEDALANLLQVLSREQQTDGQQRVGKMFIFHDELWGLRIRKLPNPDARSETSLLLKSKSVAKELGLSTEEHDAILKGNHKLDVGQTERLKELAYQLEIFKNGLGVALTDGFLGKKLKVTDEQKTLIKAQAEIIEAKSNEALVKIMEAAQNESLLEVTPPQRIKAKKLLGKPFVFRE